MSKRVAEGPPTRYAGGNTENRADIGRRLAQIRGRLSQPAFASGLGVHKNTYGGYERGETEIGADALRSLAQQGWNINWVLTGHGPERLEGLHFSFEATPERGFATPDTPLSHPEGRISPKITEAAEVVKSLTGLLNRNFDDAQKLRLVSLVQGILLHQELSPEYVLAEILNHLQGAVDDEAGGSG